MSCVRARNSFHFFCSLLTRVKPSRGKKYILKASPLCVSKCWWLFRCLLLCTHSQQWRFLFPSFVMCVFLSLECFVCTDFPILFEPKFYEFLFIALKSFILHRNDMLRYLYGSNYMCIWWWWFLKSAISLFARVLYFILVSILLLLFHFYDILFSIRNKRVFFIQIIFLS